MIFKILFLTDPVCCPAFLPSAVASHVQLLLSTQFWKDLPNYSNFSISDGFSATDVQGLFLFS